MDSNRFEISESPFVKHAKEYTLCQTTDIRTSNIESNNLDLLKVVGKNTPQMRWFHGDLPR